MADPSQIISSVALGPEQLFQRREMVEQQIRNRGIRDPRVLEAMLAVPRHAFIPVNRINDAYKDQPVPIGEGQTISQPYMVASMSEALELTGPERVLEIGTGSGYQTAVLSLLAREVHTIENHAALAEAAQERLARLGYRNIFFHVGDGTLGCPEAAPFDAILVTAAAPQIPPPLLAQLAEGGRMLLPLGSTETQELARVRRHGEQITTERLYHCRFVPLIGRYGWSEGTTSSAASGPTGDTQRR
jgi:protein-L-isoaspartate(D-aspartate) O-methyltransferase